MLIVRAMKKATPMTAGVSVTGFAFLTAARLIGADTTEGATIGIGTGYATAGTGIATFLYYFVQEQAQRRRRRKTPDG